MKLNITEAVGGVVFLTALLIAVPAVQSQEFSDEVSTIEIEEGLGVGEGEVGTGHEAFRFTLEETSDVNVEVVVTEVMQGAEYTDDDSVLYLIDEDARLIAEDDDSGEGYASRIEWDQLEPGTYYAVVVTYGNKIKKSSDDKVKGFGDSGKSRFSFDLRVLKEEYFAKAVDSLHEPTDVGKVEGRADASGTVGERHEAFAFSVEEPSTAQLEVVVTDVMEGVEYEDDDSVLYLFDDRGRLLDKDDDSGEGYASYLEVELPKAGQYYAVVTTYGDEPTLDQQDYLVEFEDTGKSRFDFDLELHTTPREDNGPSLDALGDMTNKRSSEARAEARALEPAVRPERHWRS
ncbi:MAG: DVUA0089 family protein [Spirochaetia bacterium]